eukprot:TRINITY_DN377_c0_g1_i1.p1 TRINITY_DN377_c0_g1~~TRINITY_DN377_c0_g1_i1.p1  ORF type:complete len:190 (+),score=37.39 TRINITY_DN377_c0_g1_i1:153-722(+)
MKRNLSSSSTDSDVYLPPEEIQSNTSYPQWQRNNNFWFFLRKYKKRLRDSYVNDVQKAFNRGFKEGMESTEVHTLARQQYQQGHAQGMYNAIARVRNPKITISPSPYAPNFVVSWIKELQIEFDIKSKKEADYLKCLSVALREGTFRVKQGINSIAVKSIWEIKTGRKKRKRTVEDVISEMEDWKKVKK